MGIAVFALPFINNVDDYVAGNRAAMKLLFVTHFIVQNNFRHDRKRKQNIEERE